MFIRGALENRFSNERLVSLIALTAYNLFAFEVVRLLIGEPSDYISICGN